MPDNPDLFRTKDDVRRDKASALRRWAIDISIALCVAGTAFCLASYVLQPKAGQVWTYDEFSRRF